MYKETLWQRYSKLKIDRFFETTEYTNLVEVLNDLFPDKWEIKIDCPEAIVFQDFTNMKKLEYSNFSDYINSYFNSSKKLTSNLQNIKLNIILHYPVINIKNRDNLSHIIRDLWVKLIIPCFNKNCLIDLDGLRTTISKVEYTNGYAHSHLPSYFYKEKDNEKWNNFCMGSSELGCCLQKDVLNPDKMKILQFFFLLQSYLEYESIEGVPYIRLENCRNLSDLENIYYENNEWDYIKTKKAPFKLSKELKIINREEVDQWLVENKVRYLSTKIENKYYSILSKETAELINENNGSHIFTFKNKEIKLKISNYEDKQDVRKFTNPSFTETYIKYWETRILETYIKKYRIEGNSKLNNPIQSIESNQIPEPHDMGS